MAVFKKALVYCVNLIYEELVDMDSMILKHVAIFSLECLYKTLQITQSLSVQVSTMLYKVLDRKLVDFA